MEKKTHYRKVFKSDHLGVADLEEILEDGGKLVFTIKEVKQEYGAKVAGKKIDANIAYFNENIKPLVLNATNSKQVGRFSKSSFVEDWVNVPVELYAKQDVKMKGETVGGVRIKPSQPVIMTIEDVKSKIDSCTLMTQLNELRPEIAKYKLSELATSKATELKPVSND